MTDRTVKVTLIAQASGYIAGMDQVAAKTRTAGSEIDKLAQKKQAFTTLGVGAVAFGTAIALGLGLAVSKAAEFDQAMSNANAILQESAANQKLLRQSALDAGGATIFTATEAANAEEELGKAGLTTSNILGGALSGSLALAASGQLDVADAAQITGVTLKQFALDGTQAGRVADVLSAGANKAVGSVDDLAQGLKFVGPVTNSMNVSLEDTVATLALFADQGVIGEQAGTSLRGMLSSLTSPSKQAQQELAKYNITLYDAQGKFLGLQNVAGQLHDQLGGLSQSEQDMALGMVFGNQQVTAARILVQSGAQKWQDYRKAVDDAGVAQKIANERLNNLKGDVEKLSGSFDTLMISMGESASNGLRPVVQGLTAIVDGFGNLPAPMQSTVFIAVAVVGGIALIGGTALLAVPKIAQFRDALRTLNVTGSTLVRGGKWAVGITAGLAAVTGAVSAFGESATLSQDQVGELSRETNSVDFSKLESQLISGSKFFGATLGSSTISLKDAVGDWNNFFTPAAEAFGGAVKFASFGLVDLNETALQNKAVFAQIGQSLATLAQKDLPSAQRSFKGLVDQLVSSGMVQSDAIRQALALMPEYRAQLEAIADQYGVNLDENNVYMTAIGNSPEAMMIAKRAAQQQQQQFELLGGSADGAADEVDGLSDAIRGFASLTLDARAAERSFQEAVDDASDTLQQQQDAYVQANGSLDGFNASLDESTQAGRDNEAALDAIAKAALDASAATYDNTHSVDDATAAIVDGRAALIAQLAQFGIAGQAAEDYADKLGLIPGNVETTVHADTAQAQQAIDDLLAQYRGVQIGVGIYANKLLPNEAGGIYSGGVKAFASGGFGSGIYSDRQGPLYKFAEPGTGFEAFVSGKPSERQRNVGIWQQVGERLGVWRQAPLPYAAMAASAGSRTDVQYQQTVVLGPEDDPRIAGRQFGREFSRRIAGNS